MDFSDKYINDIHKQNEEYDKNSSLLLKEI